MLNLRRARRTPCVSSPRSRSTLSEERIKRSSMGKLSRGLLIGWVLGFAPRKINCTLVCLQVEWTAGGIPPNQQAEPEEETQGGAYNLSGNPSLSVKAYHSLIWWSTVVVPFPYFDSFTCSCPGAGPSQGSSDWLWYPWGGQSSGLELYHLARGT